jgi:hypothetical protein
VARLLADLLLGLTALLYVASTCAGVGGDLVGPARFLFVPLAVAWLIAIIAGVRAGRWPGTSLLQRTLRQPQEPRASTAAFGRASPLWTRAAGLVAPVSLFLALAISPNTPGSVDGRFYLPGHGTRSIVSEQQYLIARGWQARQALSGVALGSVFFLMYLDAWRSRAGRAASGPESH